MDITIFTDPSCPYAYSSEPSRLKLMWLYGDQLKIENKMIVLNGFDGETTSLTPEYIVKSRLKMRSQYGMPMSDSRPSKISSPLLACQAYTALSLNAPSKSDLFLRHLRIASMNQELIDELSVINSYAEKVGVSKDDLSSWLSDPKTKEKLTSDVADARSPGKKALNMSHKLSKTSKGVVRYPAPSYVFKLGDEIVYELPGYWPVEAYESAIGNFLPNLERRKKPKSPEELLDWSEYPLSTKEVSVICELSLGEVTRELKQKATFSPFGQDGFWSL